MEIQSMPMPMLKKGREPRNASAVADIIAEVKTRNAEEADWAADWAGWEDSRGSVRAVKPSTSMADSGSGSGRGKWYS